MAPWSQSERDKDGTDSRLGDWTEDLGVLSKAAQYTANSFSARRTTARFGFFLTQGIESHCLGLIKKPVSHRMGSMQSVIGALVMQY